MKKIIILFLMLNSSFVFAQIEWAPIGAKWHFNQPSSTKGNYITFVSKKDSVINGKSVSVIEVRLNGVNLTQVSQLMFKL